MQNKKEKSSKKTRNEQIDQKIENMISYFKEIETKYPLTEGWSYFPVFDEDNLFSSLNFLISIKMFNIMN